jgi:hypothetical protein
MNSEKHFLQIYTAVSFVRYFCHPKSRDFLACRNIPAWLQDLNRSVSVYYVFQAADSGQTQKEMLALKQTD